MKILIVEDNSVSRKSIKIALQNAGFFVAEASSGDTAMKLIKQESFVLVVADMRLPDMDGFALVGLIKSLFPSLPVICITAYYFMEKREILKAGFDDFLVKPFNMVDLVNMTRKLLGGH